jgi:hypothetical protein
MAAGVAKVLVLALLLVAGPVVGLVAAQVTTGIVSGSVRDEQGASVPGATVVLISATRATRVAEAQSDQSGAFVIPNVQGDRYTIEVTLTGFRPLRREGVTVSPGDRVVLPPLTLSVGALADEVTVTAEAALIQAASGERSFTVATESVQNLPFANRNFAATAILVPGVGAAGVGATTGVSAAGGVTRVGGGGQNNIMMDGLSTMDTGNNGQNIQINTEGIAEVKILTQGYQAEYGRSSGLQITAVTKSGTNQFHGSVYDIRRNSDWNENSWVNQKNGDPKPVSKEDDWGYSIGGPIGRPGGDNRLFFFYSHEFRPRTTGGNITRFRVPTALERSGDFSQTKDNNGAAFPYVRDSTTGLPCGAADTRGCFQDGGVVGRIPADRLYQPGLAILSRWPMPNTEQAAGSTFNLQLTRPVIETLTHQPVVRADYQVSSGFRLSAKYAAQWAPRFVNPGTIPGVNDTINWNPNRHAPSITVNYMITPSMFVEGSYGFSFNEIDIIFANPEANRLNGLADLPMLYPTAGDVRDSSHAAKVLTAAGSEYYQGGKVLLPPVFTWGNRIGTAPPSWAFGLININPSHDLTLSLTKIVGRHTIKTGFYWNHAFKAQQEQLGGSNTIRWQGDLDFSNNTANPVDTGFGFANAATGTYNSYAQRAFMVEGAYVYSNIDFYAQDNWKVTNRMTLDYGLRFSHMQPTYDKELQGATFLLDRWDPSKTPMLYEPACVGGANPCSGNNRRALDPRTGGLLPAGSAALIGQLVPNTGDPINGVVRQGDGISKYGYTWPGLVIAPRFGMAYDLTGDQQFVLRGGMGLFHDRPAGDTAYNMVQNPPFNSSRIVRFGQLQNLASAEPTQGPNALAAVWPLEADIPSSVQWNAGVQVALPWASAVDISYVGQHGFNQLAEVRGQKGIDINAPDIGAAFLPENQDPTLAASATPGATAFTTDFLRPYQGFGSIEMNLPQFHDTFHSIQTGWNRRFSGGFGFQGSYTLTLSHHGNILPIGSPLTPLRLQHNADGSYSVRADQKEYEELNKDMGTPTHIVRINGVWDLPDLQASSKTARVVAAVINDWQLSGVLAAGSGASYDVGYQYQGGLTSVNLTGSPTYPARTVISGDTGSGCSSDQYSQFNTSAFSGPLPGSIGLESGRNYMTGCANKTVDLAIARNIRIKGSNVVQLRVDVFNAFNTVVYNGRQTSVQLNNPVAQSVVNNQYLTDGTLNPARLIPRNAGFGAVTSAQAMRSVQAQIRFQF